MIQSSAADANSASMLERAKDILIAEQTVSISLLQRHLKLGYRTALSLMAELEQNEIVTPINDEGNRTLTASYRTGNEEIQDR